MAIIAAGIVAMMSGCDNKSSADSKVSESTTENGSEVAFDVPPEESATNATYTTTAKGDFPPAPPSASLQKAIEEANSDLASRQ